jgi:hypothetical protein
VREGLKRNRCLEAAPGIRAVAIFEELCPRDSEMQNGVGRTLERRIAQWRALNGPNRHLIFRQKYPSGWMGRTRSRGGWWSCELWNEKS